MPNTPVYPTDMSKVYLSYPFGWRVHPVTGELNHHFGTDWAPYDGLPGLPIYAVQTGILREFQWLDSRGWYATIEHTDDTYTSEYMHMQGLNTSLSVGQLITKGQLLGWMGNTGISSGVHIHLSISTTYPEIYDPNGPGSYIDAELYLSGAVDPGPGPDPSEKKKGLGIVYWGKPRIY